MELPDIDARHSNTRDEDVRLVGDFLTKFALLTELKVTGSGKKSTFPQFMRPDLWKLGLFSLVNARHKATLVGLPATHDLTLRTYTVIMDNFSKDGKFKSVCTSKKLNDIFADLSESWPKDVEKPAILVLSSPAERAAMTVYGNFTEENVP